MGKPQSRLSDEEQSDTFTPQAGSDPPQSGMRTPPYLPTIQGTAIRLSLAASEPGSELESGSSVSSKDYWLVKQRLMKTAQRNEADKGPTAGLSPGCSKALGSAEQSTSHQSVFEHMTQMNKDAHAEDISEQITVSHHRRKEIWHSSNAYLQQPMSLDQCMAVQESWKTLSAYDPHQLGVQFFMTFFMHFPDYRNFYPHFRSDSDLSDKGVNRRELRSMCNSVLLKKLAGAYVASLSAIFDKLDNELELTHLLHSITDQHYPKGVLHLHFQDMMTTLMVFVEEAHNHGMTSFTREAWQSALRIITEIVEDYYLDLQHKKVLCDDDKDEKKKKDDDDNNDDGGFDIWGDS